MSRLAVLLTQFMRTRPESSMRSPLSEYQMSAGVCTELRASKNRLREAGTAGSVGDRVTMVSLYRTAGIAPGTGGRREPGVISATRPRGEIVIER